MIDEAIRDILDKMVEVGLMEAIEDGDPRGPNYLITSVGQQVVSILNQSMTLGDIA